MNGPLTGKGADADDDVKKNVNMTKAGNQCSVTLSVSVTCLC